MFFSPKKRRSDRKRNVNGRGNGVSRRGSSPRSGDSGPNTRKRARTFGGSPSETGGVGSGAVGGGSGRVSANGRTLPRTGSMLARGFQDKAWRGGGGARDGGWEQGWEEGGGEGDVEWYEDDAREMEGFGWNHVWRRGERGDLGAVGGGDGLDEGLRTLARKVCACVGGCYNQDGFCDSSSTFSPCEAILLSDGALLEGTKELANKPYLVFFVFFYNVLRLKPQKPWWDLFVGPCIVRRTRFFSSIKTVFWITCKAPHQIRTPREKMGVYPCYHH